MRLNQFRVAVINARSCADTPLDTPQSYCAAYTEDHRQAIAHVARKYPHAPLFAVGYSLGANILTKMMGEDGAFCPLAGGATIGNPWDVARGMATLDRGWITRWLYSPVLAMNLANILSKHAHKFKGTPLQEPFETIYSIRSMREFDTKITAPMFGFNSVEEYYRECSSARFLAGVQRPLLSLACMDDPICDYLSVPLEAIQKHPYSILVTTKSGGHSMDTFEGLFAKSFNTTVVSQFFSAVMTSSSPAELASSSLLDHALRSPPGPSPLLYVPVPDLCIFI